MIETRWVVLAPSAGARRIVPIHSRVLIGRTCVGVPDWQRLVLDDPEVSRAHCELRVSPGGETVLLDRSTNGTRLNGVAVARDRAVPLRDGDRIGVGAVELQFREMEPQSSETEALRRTAEALIAGRLTLPGHDRLATLTTREREILALVAQGLSNAGIARALSLSARTVDAHLRRIMAALDLPEGPDDNRRVHAVLAYLRAISLEPIEAGGDEPAST